MTEITTTSVVGVGKLGAPMVACLASKGYQVLAADTDATKVAALQRGEAPVFEPGLAEMLAKHGDKIHATGDIAQAVRDSQMTFLVVPTPSDDDGEFSLRYVLPACEAVGRALRDKAGFHVVVLTSTVMPGATGGAVQNCLERSSGLRCGEDFGLCYSPEFIALGSVIHDLLHPDFILIGESDTRAGDGLASVYRRVCESSPPVFRSNFVNAELAKIAVNTYVTTKISYANMLSEICERLPGADVDIVTAALGMDSRIGRKYLKGATGYGGPCFPRDNVAFARLARRLGGRALLAEATDAVNREQTGRLTRLVAAHAPAGATVAVLGLAYKPGTDVVTESQGVALARNLSESGYRVVAYDPAAMENARAILGEAVAFTPSVGECVAHADVVVITTPDEEFKTITPPHGARADNLVIIDCWRILGASPLKEQATYISLGVGRTTPIEGRE